MDDVNIDQFDIQVLKKVIDGERITVDVQLRGSERKQLRCPTIFISDHHPETFNEGSYIGLFERFFIVESY